MDIDDFLRHGNDHRELMTKFEQINALLHQLTDGDYLSLEVYMNNCNHLREQINRAMALTRNRDFEEYLIKNDTSLYYNLQSVMLAVRLLKNFLENIASTVKYSQLETD
ncbi:MULTISPECIES: hypothetical protein [Erwiniaceae]|uniref:hypothetical protein n=1 Tax=Erwiniaceae TaxID=1903409 RepID=UPI0019097DF5|nr:MULTISPECIES: hypothetical protein [Erwiniaceae]MBK0004759.1 hypothetical protein [Erwinia sp. S38]MBK0094000.1 hypothetical protein [Erwinia sp. S59]MBK0127910.1 hypothetical protein [Pantoea sp. S61]